MDPSVQNGDDAIGDNSQPVYVPFSRWADNLDNNLMDAYDILRTRRQDGLYQEKDLDAALHHIDNVALELRCYRNKSSLIHRLPPELLGRIYLVVCTSEPPEFYTGYRTGSIGWIKIAHVCQHWREIALSMPLLWAQCVFSLPLGHETRLALSQNAPLAIKFDVIDARVPLAVVESATSHVARAKEISILESGYSDFLWRPWRNAFSGKDLPCLRILSVSRPSTVESEMLKAAPCTAPKLRSVRFANAFVPFVSSSLRELEITFSNGTDNSRLLSARDFLSFIEPASSTLEKLFLVNSIPDMTSVNPDFTPRVISLPRLQVLQLDSSTRRCVALKKLLNTPPSIDVLFRLDGFLFTMQDVDDPAPPSERFSSVVRALEPYIYGTSPAHPIVGLAHTEYSGNDSLQTCLCTRNPDSIQAWTGPFGKGFDLTTNIQMFQWFPSADGPNLLSTFASLTAASSFSHIEILEFTMAFQDYPEQRWRDVLAPLKSIRTLFIDDEAGQHPYHGLITALDRPGSHDAVVDPSTPIFPNLHTLWFYHIDLDGNEAYIQARDAFVDMISYRSDRMGLQRLNIDNISADHPEDVDPYVGRLRALVSVSQFSLKRRTGSPAYLSDDEESEDENDQAIEGGDGGG